MKQVTIAGVKDFINEIEKGGLSLREEYVLACLRELVAVTEQRDALVVENGGLNSAHKSAIDAILNPKNNGVIYLNDTLITSVKTPATDAAIASLRADAGATAIEQFALLMRSPGDDPFLDAVAEGVAGAADNFARQLRESKGEVSNG